MAVRARLEENDCHCGNWRYAHRKSGSKHLSTFSFIGATPPQELASLFTVPLHCTDSVATLLYNVHKIGLHATQVGENKFLNGILRLTLQSRNTRAGSVRAARQAGSRQAETAVIIITASADPNTRG